MIGRRSLWRTHKVVEVVCLAIFAVGLMANAGLVGWLGVPSGPTQLLITGATVVLVLLRTPVSRTVALVSALGLSWLGAGNMPRYLRLLDSSDVPLQCQIAMGVIVLTLNVAVFSLAIERAQSWWRGRLGSRPE